MKSRFGNSASVLFLILFWLVFMAAVPEHYGPPGMKAPWPAGISYLCIKGRYGDTHLDEHTYHAFDFEMPIGSRVAAAADGVVSLAGYTGEDGYGNQLRIRHRNGSYTLYAHLSGHCVRVGQRVKQGQVIGFSGVTGYTFSPHLHFCVITRDNISLPSVFADIGVPVEDRWYTSKNR